MKTLIAMLLLFSLTAAYAQMDTSGPGAGSPVYFEMDPNLVINFWLSPQFEPPRVAGYALSNDWHESRDDNYQLEHFILPMLEDPSFGLSGTAEPKKSTP